MKNKILFAGMILLSYNLDFSQFADSPWIIFQAGLFRIRVKASFASAANACKENSSASNESITALFTDVTSAAGLDSTLGGSSTLGVASWGDYDNDGYEDLFLQDGRLFRNRGDGTFEEVVAYLSLFPPSFSAIWIDYNNDGALDLGVVDAIDRTRQRLYRGDGSGFFEEVTGQARLLQHSNSTRANSWADYNQDGHIDWYVGAGGGTHSLFYHNNGDGTFSNVADTVGVIIPNNRFPYAAAWCDYDNDHDMDLFVGYTAGDFHRLFNNDGSGRFTDVWFGAGMIGHTWAADWGDYDNDGFFDLFLPQVGSRANLLYHNNGDGTFKQVALQLEIAGHNDSKGVRWLDYDNDGDLDLLVANTPLSESRFFFNNGDGTFAPSVEKVFLPPSAERGNRFSLADYDGDGDLDLILNGRLYQNNNSTRNNWIHVRAIGTVSNKAAIGTRVRIVQGETSQIREVTGGTGQGQNSLPVEFGLGVHSTIDSLVIRWPSGLVDIVTNVSADQLVVIEEGNGMVTGVEQRLSEQANPDRFLLAQNYPNPFNPSTIIEYEVAHEGEVNISVYNLLGQKVITLVQEIKSPGRYRVEWSGKSTQGRLVPSGIYHYRLESQGLAISKKMLLLK